MSNKSVFLISGVNRGIGLGLVQAYLSRADSVVIAAVRDPSSTSSKSLSNLRPGKGSKIIVIKLDSLAETDAKEAISQLKSDHGIDHLDTVIANAGIANYWGSASVVPTEAMRDHFNVNTIGTLTLFQAAWPLLERSSSPKFVFVSSTVGSLGDMEKWPLKGVAYGASKAAMNYIVRKIHIEQEALTIFSIHPGWVQTEMGNSGAVANGLAEAPVTLEESVSGLVSKIDAATRNSTSGTFVSFDGAPIAW